MRVNIVFLTKYLRSCLSFGRLFLRNDPRANDIANAIRSESISLRAAMVLAVPATKTRHVRGPDGPEGSCNFLVSYRSLAKRQFAPRRLGVLPHSRK